MHAYCKITFKSFLKFKRKRRSLTLVLAGAFFLIFFLISMFSTLFNNIEEYWGKMLLGNGSIVLKEYKDYKVFKPAKKEYYFSYNKIENELKEVEEINFSKRLRIFALVEGYGSEQKHPLVLLGIEPDKEHAVTPNIQLAEGRFPQAGKKEICMFLNVSGRLDVDVGDSVIIYVKNVDGYMDYDLLTVSGIIEPKKTQYFYGAGMIGFIPLSFATAIKSVDKDIVSEVVFSSGSFIQKVILSYTLPEKFKVVGMWDSEEVPLTMRWMYNSMLWVMLILMIGIVLSSIYHNVHLMLLERYKEIGVYLTFGATGWWIFKLLLGEFTFYLIYCSIIGGILSTLIILGINSVEFHATDITTEIFLCSRQFHIYLFVKHYVFSFLLLWLVVLIASITPILKGINEAVIIKLFRR